MATPRENLPEEEAQRGKQRPQWRRADAEAL